MRQAVFILILIHCSTLKLFSQRLPFQNFGIDKGLIQSQVLSITQDKQRHLWLGTFAGADRFDGTSFRHFTKSEGLNSSTVTCLYAATNGNIWAATFKGISCNDGFSIINYPIKDQTGSFNFTSITEDETGTIWAFDFKKGLYFFQDKQFVKASLPFDAAIPTCLCRNFKGKLLVSFYKKGIFVYEKKSWNKFDELPIIDSSEIIGSIDHDDSCYYAFTNHKKILKYANGKIIAETKIDAPFIVSHCIDDNNNIWIGTNKGIILINKNDFSVEAKYTAVSGLSDNLISSLFKDVEGNIWIGSDGDGLFKFSGGAFTKYDNSNGLPGNIVMGILNDRSGNLYIGTRENGLVKYNTLEKKFTELHYSSFSKAGVNCMGSDARSNIFVGTMDSRLLKYDGKVFKEIFLEKKSRPFVNTIIADGDKIWITTSSGCYYLQHDSSHKIEGIEEITVGALPVGNNQTLNGTTNGIFLVSEKMQAEKIDAPSLQHAEVRCFGRYHDFILIGTADDGIYWWNRKSNAVYTCSTKDGLTDNQVFSIFIDSKENIWVGTGTGINQIKLDEKKFSFSVKRFSKEDGYENSESNLNAIAEDKDGKIWIGTTKGAFIFNENGSFRNDTKPFVVMQNVILSNFSKDSGTKNNISQWYHLPLMPTLLYGNTNISFTAKGIFLKDPESLKYSYKLAGYDTAFSKPVTQTFFNYQSLEPGKYTFMVKAFTLDGLQSGNVAEYSFVVSTPFRKTKPFIFLTIAALILIGVLAQYLFTKAKQRKQKQLELFRQNEQQKIRQRTSEDFHDELGNKLTRISLLTDILQRKAGGSDLEKNNIIQQIKENVLALYGGTKDIIWSLSPGSDNLVEILKRIKHFGDELFQDSDIEFEFRGLNEIKPEIQLPIDYSRNLIMIYKEILNNSLRHSQCTKVSVTVKNITNDEILILQEDDGKGFNENEIQKGNGLNNIRQRASRINAAIKTESADDAGTKIFLSLKIPSNGG